jgi:AcrR family transcriptional regulator
MVINLNDPQAKEAKDTKIKIMAYANELFARGGYDGVSVRDIAQMAEVNVASINYHFSNKLNLFHSIFEYNYQWMEDKVKEIGENQSLDTAAMTAELFKIFSTNGRSLINSFNLILNEQLAPAEEKLSNEGEPFGPPGNEALLKVITREVGEKVPFEERDWAVRMIFSNIFHIATMVNTKYLKSKCAGEPWMDPEVTDKNMRKFGQAIIDSIKK